MAPEDRFKTVLNCMIVSPLQPSHGFTVTHQYLGVPEMSLKRTAKLSSHFYFSAKFYFPPKSMSLNPRPYQTEEGGFIDSIDIWPDLWIKDYKQAKMCI